METKVGTVLIYLTGGRKKIDLHTSTTVLDKAFHKPTVQGTSQCHYQIAVLSLPNHKKEDRK
jgi:hypothetical protein